MSTEISAPVMNITELCMKTITNAMKQPIEAIVRTLSEYYGFDFDDAMRVLGNPVVNVKPMAKRGSKKAAAAVSSSDASSSDESTKAKKGKKIPLPFMAELVRPDLCQGMTFGYGLFPQCQKAAEAGGQYCAKCQKEADASSNRIPKCGNVERRLAMGDKYEDLSDKPRKVANFAKILATKYPNVSEEDVRAEAARRGVELDDAIFVIPEAKPRGGRPKKAAAATTTEDETKAEELVASAATTSDGELEAEAEVETEESGAESGADETKAEANMPHVVIAISEPPTKRKYVRKTAEEKAQLEARRLEKERKAAEKKAEKERKEAEKKQQEETVPAPVPVVEAEVQEEKVVEVAPAPAPVQPVKKTKIISIDGEKCVVDLMTNIVYRKSDVVAIGTWDPETKEFTPYDEEEVEDEDV